MEIFTFLDKYFKQQIQYYFYYGYDSNLQVYCGGENECQRCFFLKVIPHR